jgi:antitoxin ParD1/3/4
MMARGNGKRSRMARESVEKLAALRAALVAGEQSGPPAPLDFEAFIARKLREGRSPDDKS